MLLVSWTAGAAADELVWTEAATSGKRDLLVGLKENVIMGHLVPAGTGHGPNRTGEMIKAAPAAVTLPTDGEDDGQNLEESSVESS